VKVSQVSSLQDAYASFGSLKYFAKHGNLDSLLQIASDAKWARGIGDFWSYHLLIQGKLEIMIEADTKLWDIAAMKVIVEEAGGKLTQLDGQEINPSTYTAVATNSLLHDTVVDSFRKS
jgi:histidinol-phosphatase